MTPLSETQADVLDSVAARRHTLARLIAHTGRPRNTVRGALQQLRGLGLVTCWRPQKGPTQRSRWSITKAGRLALRRLTKAAA